MRLKNLKYKSKILSLSLIAHALIFFILSLLQTFISKNDFAKTNYLSLSYNESKENMLSENLENNLSQKANNDESQSKDDNSKNYYYDSLIQKFDSTDLVQTFSDDTRGIKINYPAGWKYLDQKLNNKLDGVTFWSEELNLNSPPYIHLEIADKELFTESRFQSKIEFSDIVWFYNPPNVIDEYVNFEIYLKTKEDVDYRIKLIIKGIDNFYSFQPKFLAMVKSLKFEKDFLKIFN